MKSDLLTVTNSSLRVRTCPASYSKPEANGTKLNKLAAATPDSVLQEHCCNKLVSFVFLFFSVHQDESWCCRTFSSSYCTRENLSTCCKPEINKTKVSFSQEAQNDVQSEKSFIQM